MVYDRVVSDWRVIEMLSLSWIWGQVFAWKNLFLVSGTGQEGARWRLLWQKRSKNRASEIRHAPMWAIFHFAENRRALSSKHWKFVFSAVSGQHTTGNYCCQHKSEKCLACRGAYYCGSAQLRLLLRGIKSRLSAPWFLLHAKLSVAEIISKLHLRLASGSAFSAFRRFHCQLLLPLLKCAFAAALTHPSFFWRETERASVPSAAISLSSFNQMLFHS